MLNRLALSLLLVAGCGAPIEDEEGDDFFAEGKEDGTGSALDILSTSLDIDLAKHEGRAVLRLRSGMKKLSLEAAGLDVTSVRTSSGPLKYKMVEGRIQATTTAKTLTVDYGFAVQDHADGLLAGGSTLVWPYFCGNLFPCNSSPRDGMTFDLSLAGVPSGAQAVYPTSIPNEAPSYMLAWAVGNYGYRELGVTAAGTKVGVYWLDDESEAALAGTAHLVKAFEWYEQTIGPYMFGNTVASVAATWGEGAFGGMEHHPMWHVAREAMADAETHAHEAAHGWFGDGVRIRCWEDFVLSEGTVSYLTARAMGYAAGARTEARLWKSYGERLRQAVAEDDGIAWPESCGKVDILKDGLFSDLPYMKGAFFLKAVSTKIGVAELDQVLARFYDAHRGKAAGMADLLEAIERDTGFAAAPLAQAWLRERGIPN